MLAAVYLNDELSLTANEIAKVGADRRLPCESMAINLSSTKMLPKFCLWIRLVDAKAS